MDKTIIIETLKKFLYPIGNESDFTDNDANILNDYLHIIDKETFYQEIDSLIPPLSLINENTTHKEFLMYEAYFRLKFFHINIQLQKHMDEASCKYKANTPVDALELVKDYRENRDLLREYDLIEIAYNNYRDIYNGIKLINKGK